MIVYKLQFKNYNDINQTNKCFYKTHLAVHLF